MKKLVISALALGAMTSVALAEEPLTQTGQPMQLSLSQLDSVTAGRIRIDANVAVFRVRQSNWAEQLGGVFADDISGKCNNCTVLVDGSNNLVQSNNVEFKQRN